jgi:ankyrin repeat protein
VNAANAYGITPLYLACLNGNPAMAEKLLKAGANANAALPSGETVLMRASRTGNGGCPLVRRK